MICKNFHVTSSDGVTSYIVSFEYDGQNLRVNCDCKAGSLGQMCRHKESLILGDVSILAVADDLSGVLNWVSASPIQHVLANFLDAQEKVRLAHAAEKTAKKALASLLSGSEGRK